MCKYTKNTKPRFPGVHFDGQLNYSIDLTTQINEMCFLFSSNS